MGVTYFKWWGFSINEGKHPANIHISWLRKSYWLFIYVFVLGHRLSWAWVRTISIKEKDKKEVRY